ncbi:MAG: hypothetical protein QM757_09555 [Paludibaculum sp.]
MASTDWATLLDEGAFEAALDAWQAAFAGADDSLDATWARAEIEERWGDHFFFGKLIGASGHYHAALRWLVPQGMLFTSIEENDRRMEAHGRVMDKLYAVDGSGFPRPGNDGRPHPNAKLLAPPPQRVTLPEPPVMVARREAVLRARDVRKRRELPAAALFRDAGHWDHYQLGRMWSDAGKALAPALPDEARRAYAWSQHWFELYNTEWTANLPASRWDSDGGQEIMEAQEASAALAEEAPGSECPVWIGALLDGRWREAVSALDGQKPPADYASLATILFFICRAAGHEEAARFLAPEG